MLAVLQSLADRNAPQLDANRRIRDELQHAQQNVDDTQQKLDKIKNQLSELTPVIDAAPPGDLLESLTGRKNALEHAQLEAESAVNRDHADLQRLAAPQSADTTPAIADPQLKQMRQRLADLSAEVDSTDPTSWPAPLWRGRTSRPRRESSTNKLRPPIPCSEANRSFANSWIRPWIHK